MCLMIHPMICKTIRLLSHRLLSYRLLPHAWPQRWTRGWAIGLAITIGFFALPSPVYAAPDGAGGITASPAVDLENGAEIFEIHCAGCHPNGGNIIRRGKNLYPRALRRYQMDSLEAIAQIVTHGKRPMSAYDDKLTAAEIQNVSAYVLQRAEENWN